MDAKQLLKSIVKDEGLVKEHYDWGSYIEVSFNEIKKIGLIKRGNDLELSFYFGASQSQSRSFYNGVIDLKFLLDSEWKIFNDFHLSNSLQNLIWFESVMSANDYISFWKQNKYLLYQHDRNNVTEFLDFLAKKGVINFDHKEKERFNIEILTKEYSRFNICATLGVIYRITQDELNKLIEEKELNNFLRSKINQALRIIGKNGKDFFKDFLNEYTKPITNDKVDPDGL